MVFFKSLTEKLLKEHKKRIFIETGTQHGNGIQVALDCGFEKIYSIDIDPKYHYECSNKFNDAVKSGQLELFIGDSATSLGQILSKIDEPVTFWLDAHGDSGIVGKTTCPISYELEQISKHSINTHTILIDDRRMFGIYWGTGTTEADVINLLKQINPEYKISYADGCEPNDVIVAHV
jgi:hypothetical protein